MVFEWSILIDSTRVGSNVAWNIGLGWKWLSTTNTTAYNINYQIKIFYTIGPWDIECLSPPEACAINILQQLFLVYCNKLEFHLSVVFAGKAGAYHSGAS